MHFSSFIIITTHTIIIMKSTSGGAYQTAFTPKAIGKRMIAGTNNIRIHAEHGKYLT